MAWYRAGGGGIPSAIKTDMNAVLNKKFGTSQDYPPTDWAPSVNLLGPLPEKTASGSIVSFDDGADDVPIVSGLFTITPKQTGTGTPSPNNPRPIVGYTGLTIMHKDNMLTPQQSETITDTFGTTVYGGSRATDGTLTDGCIKIKLSDLSWTYQSANTRFYSNTIQNLVKRPASNNDVAENFVCECFDATKASDILNVVGDNNIGIAVSGTVFLRCTTYTDKDTLIGALGDYYLTYPLLTPNTTTLSALSINTYYGANRFISDTGDASITYRADIQLALNP